jgi:hypothetical protein
MTAVLERPGADAAARPVDPLNSIRNLGVRLNAAVRLLRPRRADGTGEVLPGGLSEVALYHDLLRARDDAAVLSARVCDDLDMDLVFRRVDSCDSTVGQQVLYSLLRRPLHRQEAIGARDALVKVLSAQADVRDRISSAVAGLRGRNA